MRGRAKRPRHEAGVFKKEHEPQQESRRPGKAQKPNVRLYFKSLIPTIHLHPSHPSHRSRSSFFWSEEKKQEHRDAARSEMYVQYSPHPSSLSFITHPHHVEYSPHPTPLPGRICAPLRPKRRSRKIATPRNIECTSTNVYVETQDTVPWAWIPKKYICGFWGGAFTTLCARVLVIFPEQVPHVIEKPF